MPDTVARQTESPRQRQNDPDRDPHSDGFEDRKKPGEGRATDKETSSPGNKDADQDQKGRDDRQEADSKEGGKDSEEENKPPPWRRPIFWIIVAAVLLLALAIGIPWWLHARSHEWTDDAFIDANTMTVSPQVAGHVVKRLVDDNQEVVAGQLLIQIDPRDFQDTLAEAQAAREVAENQIAQYQAQVTAAGAQEVSARADVATAQANAEQAHSDAERYRSAEAGAVSKLQLETQTNNERTTAAALRAAQAKLAAASAQTASAQAQIRTGEAQVKQAQARVADAELQLSYTNVYAPGPGRVTNRHVEVGSYVQIGQALLGLVPRDTWVTANFKETQLQSMRTGQSVKIKVDAYPDKTYWGHVDSIQAGSGAAFSLLPAENATGNYVKVVQRVPVKILFDQTPRELMAPGMSVVPEVTIK